MTESALEKARREVVEAAKTYALEFARSTDRKTGNAERQAAAMAYLKHEQALARYGDLREKEGYERGYNESKVCVCHIPSPDPCPRHP